MAEYPDIYNDDRLFVGWTRLLILSEIAWPNDPVLPVNVSRSVVRYLVERDILTLAGYQFQLRGYPAERASRSESGRHAATVRWERARDADAYADALRAQYERSAETMPRKSKSKSNEEVFSNGGVIPSKAIQGVRAKRRAPADVPDEHSGERRDENVPKH